MEYSNSERVISAFKLGYISAILENELNEVENPDSKLPDNDISLYLNTFLLFEEDYEFIFRESLITFPKFRNSTDKVEYLFASINLIKQQISEIDEAELELAYFCGGTLALSFEDDLGIFSEETFGNTLSLVMSLCDKSYEEVADQIEKIFSNNFYECMIARNVICNVIVGNRISESQKAAFRYLDKILVSKY